MYCACVCGGGSAKLVLGLCEAALMLGWWWEVELGLVVTRDGPLADKSPKSYQCVL